MGLLRTLLNVVLTGFATYTAAVQMGASPKAAGVATTVAVVSNYLGLSQEQVNVIGNFISSFKKKPS